MQTKAFTTTFRGLAFLAAFASLPAQSVAQIEDKAKDAVAAIAGPKDETEKTLFKLSQDGFSAMRTVRAARLALFNGKSDLVSDLLAKAKELLNQAEKEAPTFAIKTQESINGKNVGSDAETGKIDVIPIDASLALADDFVPTHEKKAHIAKANEHFKKGQAKEALDELRLGEIDVNYKRVLMPINATKKHVDQALKLIAEHQYYEANLALKAAEDGLTVDTINLAEPVGKSAVHARKPATK